MPQNIVITGANRGIGLEFARQYLETGHHVYAIIRSAVPSNGLKALADQYTELTLLKADVTSQADLEQLTISLIEKLQGKTIDLLINNAGIYGSRDAFFGNVNTEEWMQVMQVNTIAPLMVTQSLAFLLGSGSKVALISSVMGSISRNSSGQSYVYRSSKAALNAVGKSLSIDLADEGIAVGIYHPGWVQTDMGGQSAAIDPATSVEGLRQVIAALSLENSGEFINYDGSALGW